MCRVIANGGLCPLCFPLFLSLCADRAVFSASSFQVHKIPKGCDTSSLVQRFPFRAQTKCSAGGFNTTGGVWSGPSLMGTDAHCTPSSFALVQADTVAWKPNNPSCDAWGCNHGVWAVHNTLPVHLSTPWTALAMKCLTAPQARMFDSSSAARSVPPSLRSHHIGLQPFGAGFQAFGSTLQPGP